MHPFAASHIRRCCSDHNLPLRPAAAAVPCAAGLLYEHHQGSGADAQHGVFLPRPVFTRGQLHVAFMCRALGYLVLLHHRRMLATFVQRAHRAPTPQFCTFRFSHNSFSCHFLLFFSLCASFCEVFIVPQRAQEQLVVQSPCMSNCKLCWPGGQRQYWLHTSPCRLCLGDMCTKQLTGFSYKRSRKVLCCLSAALNTFQSWLPAAAFFCTIVV